MKLLERRLARLESRFVKSVNEPPRFDFTKLDDKLLGRILDAEFDLSRLSEQDIAAFLAACIDLEEDEP